MTGILPAAVVALLLSVTSALPAVPSPAGPGTPGSRNHAAENSPRAVWPLEPEPEVLARFDPPNQSWSAGHRGVDLAGSPGQPVRAAAAGTVSFAGMIAGRGVVVVAHGERRTTYEPVSATVATGTEVAAGGTLGTLQTGPGHCTPRTCLHWGLINGSEYLDPLRLLQPAAVRLLPLPGRWWTPVPRGTARWTQARGWASW